MGDFDWLGFFTGLAAVLGVVGSFAMSWRAASRQEAAMVVKQEEIKAAADDAAEALKAEAKKASDAKVEVALLEGANKGREEERAMPLIPATVPGETELTKPPPTKETRKPKPKPRAVKRKSRR